ncbi:hypothetical protein K2E96_14370 [Pseudomonas sp. ERGC3:05]|nr:hypothetical protein [Pseudomonas sp. ERGC3:01]QZC96985.1 hypothetical protein K2E96_14370 [Pseudomonas sp. ERGC3:05]
MADSPWDMLSAVGTLGAVFTALGLSYLSSRASGKVATDKAELAAAKMVNPLSVLERKASYLFTWFYLEKGEPINDYMNILRAIQELDVMARAISIDDLYPLLRLKNHAAKRSARALGLIQSFTSDATSMLTHHSWSNGALRETHHKRWAAMLSEIKDHLAIAVLACDAAASTGAPRPSTEEIMGQ